MVLEVQERIVENSGLWSRITGGREAEAFVIVDTRDPNNAIEVFTIKEYRTHAAAKDAAIKAKRRLVRRRNELTDVSQFIKKPVFVEELGPEELEDWDVDEQELGFILLKPKSGTWFKLRVAKR